METLNQAQVNMLKVAGSTILQQVDGVVSDTVLEQLGEAGINRVDAMEAMLDIHPLQIPPMEPSSTALYQKK